MKTTKLVSIFALIFILLFTASCKRRKSLAELRREERQAIAQFIKDNDINVLHEIPTDTVFLNDKDFYLSSSGLYINVANKGDGIPPRESDRVIVNYYEMNLQGDTTFRAMNAPGDDFIFRNGSAVVIAFKEAASFMGLDGEANLIVPSAIGSMRAQQDIRPYRYFIRIRIRPN